MNVHLFLELPLTLGQLATLLAVVFAGAALLILAWQGMDLIKIKARRDPDETPRSWLERDEITAGYHEHWKS